MALPGSSQIRGPPMKKIIFKFPKLKSFEIWAKVKYCSFCHSDLHTIKKHLGPGVFPIASGHEIVVFIIHIGSEVKDFKGGETVGLGCQRECCEKCKLCTITQSSFVWILI